ncbi:hypothetical protein D3Y59_00175 [Hymenobacter oligotrophus]|uniref:Uncharacterized protein n=2 Tax=Cytophagales TaxID=768507 RepID=A0A3B7QVR9_9BACT|nr:MULTISPECIES: hypothetical protein [Cytophagales]AYA35605.1 hypothetical protein D3Y59_00175 [Hymenobacter oligotrophus]KUG06791.1 hypothetical protein ASU33_05525 [Solirubrum puertoriconensis]UYZ59241.1 hypothetical protein OIS50_00205 [Hymenobacter sp. YIM 151858-1]
MANSQKKGATNQDTNNIGDPLFNLKHAQVEAELQQQTGGLGPLTNEYISTDEDGELDEGPRDSQGRRRGEPGIDLGSTAGKH